MSAFRALRLPSLELKKDSGSIAHRAGMGVERISSFSFGQPELESNLFLMPVLLRAGICFLPSQKQFLHKHARSGSSDEIKNIVVPTVTFIAGLPLVLHNS